MKPTILAIILLSLGSAVSCGHPNVRKHDATTTQKATDQQESEASQLKISLNNDGKWHSDQSTYTGMKRLELKLYTFKNNNEESSLEDYHELGIALTKINNDLISQCSMKGVDHDQLHILLAPMLTNVDVIKNGGDVDKAKANTEALAEAVAQFFVHFEVN
jgi:hypothetical protein